MKKNEELAFLLANYVCRTEISRTEPRIKEFPTRMWYYRQGAIEASRKLLETLEMNDQDIESLIKRIVE